MRFPKGNVKWPFAHTAVKLSGGSDCLTTFDGHACIKPNNPLDQRGDLQRNVERGKENHQSLMNYSQEPYS